MRNYVFGVSDQGLYSHRRWLEISDLGSRNPANRKRYRNVTVWLYEGLVIPNVAKTLCECYTKVMEALCWKQPTANVIKTFNC